MQDIFKTSIEIYIQEYEKFQNTFYLQANMFRVVHILMFLL